MTTQRIPFTEWLPDQPSTANALQDVNNVVPVTIGYSPFNLPVNFSNVASENLISAFAGKFSNLTQLYAAGQSKLFKFNASTLNLDDYSKSGGYGLSATDRWYFVQYGNVTLAVNNVNKIQSFTIGGNSITVTAGSFAIGRTYTITSLGSTTNAQWNTIAGTTGITYAVNSVFTAATAGVGTGTASIFQFNDVSANAPVAKYITIVRDFVVAANLDTGTNANKLQWSDINDETNWISVAGGSPTSQSDYQFMSEGGNITGLSGGEFGLVFLEKAIYRMSYIGSPLFFQFDAISRNLGCMEGGSIAQLSGITYFLADDGFYSCDGRNITPIGTGKIDKYFFKNLDLNNIHKISSSINPEQKLVAWSYPNQDGGMSLLIYNVQYQKWSKVDSTTTSYIANFATAGVTLEDLDNYGGGSLDAITTSLDDRSWVGGKFLFGATSGRYLTKFSGEKADATIIVGDIEQGYNSVLKLVRPQIQDGTANISTSSRRKLEDDVVFGDVATPTTEGRVNVRSAGRYHRIKAELTGDWTIAVSLDAEFTAQGNR